VVKLPRTQADNNKTKHKCLAVLRTALLLRASNCLPLKITDCCLSNQRSRSLFLFVFTTRLFEKDEKERDVRAGMMKKPRGVRAGMNKH
jgi:hypothetical protein